MIPSFRDRRRLLPFLIPAVLLCGHMAAESSAGHDRQFARYKFLLIDDESLVEHHNLRRKVNQAVKHQEPVLRLDAPWETDRDMLNYVSVMYDQEEQIFKMWYTLMRWKGNTADGPRGVAYAVSRDGLHWEKPKLGLVEVNGSREHNLVIDFKRQFVYSSSRTPATSPPAATR